MKSSFESINFTLYLEICKEEDGTITVYKTSPELDGEILDILINGKPERVREELRNIVFKNINEQINFLIK